MSKKTIENQSEIKTEVMSETTKLVQFICQSKGGAGKSVFAFLAAYKYPDAKIIDMDDATKTTMKQLAFRKPQLISFLNENELIDRAVFTEFVEAVGGDDIEHYICDLGGSTSQQLPTYFRNIEPEELKEVLNEYSINLEMICVVCGGNTFNTCMDYLKDLILSVKGQFTIKVAFNEHMPLTTEQQKIFNLIIKSGDLEVVPFNVSKDGTEIVQKRIAEVLTSGKGLEGASTFSRMYFKGGIKNLTL